MRNKKTIYIILTIFLCLMLAQMAHWLIEIWLIKELLSSGQIPAAYDDFGAHCFLPSYLQMILPVFGIIAGYFLGQAWWRIVYVEHRHWR